MLVGEPGILAFGVAPRCLLAGGDGLAYGHLAAGQRAQFGHADGAHHGQSRIEVARGEGFDFRDRPSFDHLGEAAVATRGEPVSWWQQDQRLEPDLLADPAGAFALPRLERPLGRQRHFKRAGDPRRVAVVEAGRGDRIDRHQPGQIFADAGPAHRLSHVAGDRGHRGNAVDQCAQIEPGSANQDRQPPCSVQRGDFGLGQACPFGRRTRDCSVAHPVQPVIGAGPVGG